MGKLQEKVEADLGQALKERSKVRLSTLRLLKTDLQYEMNKSGDKQLADPEMETILKRAAKKRREAIEQYEKAGRKELLEKEKAELVIIEDYLPPSVPDAEIEAIIAQTFHQNKPTGPQDIGKLMGIVMGQLKGRSVDGAHVRQLLLEKLKN